MIGKSSDGERELALPNTEEMKNRFKNEEMMDIICDHLFRPDTRIAQLKLPVPIGIFSVKS
jgi:hypothetical protein